MQGHIIFEAGNLRFVALPRDHRNGVKCGGCALFCQSVRGPHIKCPVDGAGNLVCRLGHGLTWKRIGWPGKTQEAAGELATKNTKSTKGIAV